MGQKPWILLSLLDQWDGPMSLWPSSDMVKRCPGYDSCSTYGYWWCHYKSRFYKQLCVQKNRYTMQCNNFGGTSGSHIILLVDHTHIIQ